MTNRSITPQNLQAGAAGIYYEVLMLNEAYHSYWKNETNPKFEWQHNHILEATLIRIRSLANVFEGPNPNGKVHPDDVFSSAYNFPTRRIGLPANLSTKINKRIAHISYTRGSIRDYDRYWDFKAIIPPILNRGREFFEFLINQSFKFNDWPSKLEVESLVISIEG